MVKLGIIGVGKFGTNIIHAFKQVEQQGKGKLVAICDINESMLKSQSDKYGVKGYLDYKEMFEKEELDGVAIATPDPFHKEPTIYAANLGKHVLVEKPMDVTVEGCIEMLEAAKKNNILLQVDFHKRYDPYHREICKNVRAGKFGKIEYGYVHMEDRIEVPWKWFPNWAAKSSPAWFLGIHFIDLVRWMLQSNGKRVYATGRKWKLKELGVDTYDSINALVEFKNGATITFDTSWILPEKFEAIVNQGFRLVGTLGVAECDTQNRGTIVCTEQLGMESYNVGFLLEDEDLEGNPYFSGYGIESIADFVYNLEYLNKGGSLDKIRNHAISGFAEDGLEATRIAVGIHKSLEIGEPVDL
jgi:predicted dehydrogenase